MVVRVGTNLVCVAYLLFGAGFVFGFVVVLVGGIGGHKLFPFRTSTGWWYWWS